MTALFSSQLKPRWSYRRISLLIGYYRLALSIVLMVVVFFLDSIPSAPDFYPYSFAAALIAYWFLGLLSLLMAETEPSPLTVSFGLADTLLISLAVTSTGGTESSFIALALISVATGSLLSPLLRYSLLLAAMTSLILLAHDYITHFDSRSSLDTLRTGLMGMSAFVISVAIYFLNDRSRRSENLVLQQAQSLLDQQKLQQMIVQRMRTGVVVLDQHFDIISKNSAADELIQLEEKKNLEALKHYASLWRQQPHYRPGPLKIDRRLPDIQLNFAQLNQGDPNSPILVFIEDAIKQIKQAQELKNNSLGRLSASIAHEIRNPLGAIAQAAQLLNELPVSQQQQQLIDIVLRNSHRVNDIIESVLDFSRRKPTQSESIHPAHFIDELIDELSLDSSTTHIEHNIGHSVVILFDPIHFRQILNNLIQNALRHGRSEDGILRLSIKAQRTALGQLCLVFRDQGGGVPNELQDKLFEPFFSTHKEGTGLGLHLCRELAESNQARLVFSPNEKGACFELQLNHYEESSE